MESIINQYQKKEVKEFQNNVTRKTIVSVIVVTYQHVNYIQQCLDGILMQQTDFDIEILLGEDASEDGTREICIDYAEKNPKQIRLFLHSRENNIKVNGLPTGKFIFLYNLSKASGKYIALCEGDDYWTNPYKLQKQVDFLEGNPEYGLVYSDIEMIDGEGNKITTTPLYEKQEMRYKSGNIFFDLLQSNFVNTLTVCVRADLLQNIVKKVEKRNIDFVYDYWFWLNVAKKSKIKFLNEKTATYRIHNNGISRQKGFLVKLTPLVYYDVLSEYLSEKDVKNFNSHEKDILFNIFYSLYKNRVVPKNIKKWSFKKMLKHWPSFNYIIQKVKYKIIQI